MIENSSSLKRAKFKYNLNVNCGRGETELKYGKGNIHRSFKFKIDNQKNSRGVS